ncbi:MULTISPECIES: hypothetical protein [unclassified Photobacterium]|uniref:hypothetical protein n=1 Tax=unclassified Photobacterium TaxID=2628852 RepID=UPI001EE12FE3|nr:MULTISPECIES: hypothetical protein [unclassified Photobacterium]MCG3866090.1 hypothetical protein [Photobacterium sp. Ph6]MCG3877617.1 hypothetical protein [Photobacterium sp. Ph5]
MKGTLFIFLLFIIFPATTYANNNSHDFGWFIFKKTDHIFKGTGHDKYKIIQRNAIHLLCSDLYGNSVGRNALFSRIGFSAWPQYTAEVLSIRYSPLFYSEFTALGEQSSQFIYCYMQGRRTR